MASPETVAAAGCCKEACPLRPADDDATDAVERGKETANNGCLQQGRAYRAALLPEVRVIASAAAAADERPSSKSESRVSPLEAAAGHRTGFSPRCYRTLVPETAAEKLVLSACLAVFVTLFVSLVYFFVKIECVFGTKDQKCISEYIMVLLL